MDKALTLFEDLLPVCERVLGEGHPDTLMICNNIILYTEKSGNAPRALTLVEDLLPVYLPVYVRVLGEDHPDTLVVKKLIDDALVVKKLIDRLSDNQS